MLHSTLFVISSVGTTLGGLFYKHRTGEKLKWHEWLILAGALFIWGLVSMALIIIYFPNGDHGLPSALMSIPLGIGLSELFVFMLIAIERLLQFVPELVRAIIMRRWGGGDKR